MTESACLEQRYRRLLAWYPAAFRRDQEDEMLAVLMAGARRGQRRPGLVESADLIRSAVGMHLRRIWAGPDGQPRADALALFSLAAPLFLLLATVLEAALPYRPSPPPPLLAHHLAVPLHLDGLHLFSVQGFDIAVGCQVIIAALVLLGLRRTALAAIATAAGCWVAGLYYVPPLLQVLSASVYLLVAAALIASPGPRRGRQLMTWRHGVVLLLAAAAVQVSALRYDATFFRWSLTPSAPATRVYLVTGIVLAAAAAGLAVAWRMNRYFLLLLAVMFYPYALQIAFPARSSDSDLIGHPTAGNLALLFLLPLLAACGAMIRAVTPGRSRPVPSSGQEQARPT